MAERQVVVFKLGDRDEYCIDISKVREIVRVQDITSLPGAGKYMEGIVNLRGQIVPVINIQRKFAAPAANTAGKEGNSTSPDDVQRRMIVVTMEEKHIGILVSAVSEILRVDEGNIEDAPSIVRSSNTGDFISGVAKVGERLIVILDLEKIFSPGEIKAFPELKANRLTEGRKFRHPAEKLEGKGGLKDEDISTRKRKTHTRRGRLPASSRRLRSVRLSPALPSGFQRDKGRTRQAFSHILGFGGKIR